MRRTMSILLLLVTVAACGGGGSDIASPCDLADAALVQSFFGGTVTDGVEGVARNCEFTIEGGLVEDVNVYYFGSDDGWDGTRSGFENNVGGTTDVPGIGDEAFYPNDNGPTSLVARAGGQIFEVAGGLSIFDTNEPSEDLIQAVADLAGAIADDLNN
jgi:hypothetical protein